LHNQKKRKETMMPFGTNNKTLAATALLLATSMVALSVPMVKGQLLQEKYGNLRRLEPSSTDIPSAAPSNAPLEPVKLLTAGKFAILSKTGVTTTSSTTPTSVKGDIGSSPVAGSFFTGFGLALDSSNEFATSSFVEGNLYAANYHVPTPNMLTVAVLNMQAAYVDAAGRPDPDFTELGTGQIDGFILNPGLYKWGTDVYIPTGIEFDGDENSVWILQIAGDVTIGNGANIVLKGGAKAENIFWQVAGATLFGTTSTVKGVFLCKTAIVFETSSSLNGAALAQTAVTIDTATIVKESVCDATVGCSES